MPCLLPDSPSVNRGIRHGNTLSAHPFSRFSTFREESGPKVLTYFGTWGATIGPAVQPVGPFYTWTFDSRVEDNPMALLTAWSNFYVIIGSGAAALTGLVFVVITIVAGRPNGTTRQGVSTFSTPTVVHFCSALLVSALLVVPWGALQQASVVLGIVGSFGIAYCVRVAVLVGKLSTYEPGVDDWFWHVAVPIVSYATLAGSAVALSFTPAQALFGIATAVLLLVFLAIHNAWDVVTFIAVEVVGKH